MTGKGTYVYCLVAAARRPSLARLPRGVPGTGPVRLLAVPSARRAGRWLVVADAPLARYGESAINARLQDVPWITRAAVAHERVVEAFLRRAAVLPMKLFTIFLSDERAVEDVAGSRAEIERLVRRVSGHEEWGLRVTLDRARRTAAPVQRPAGRGGGAGYLSMKKAQRDSAAELARRARESVAALHAGLADISSGAKRRPASELPVSGGSLLLDAAYLVPRARVARFRALAARAARSMAPKGYHVVVTGPWPPYSFLSD